MSTPTIYKRSQHSVSRKRISENALKVLNRLDRAGYKAFLVGGAVRDILLERDPKDFDIATNARPDQILELFRNSRLIGRRFRLAHVRFGREVIEVATFRARHEGEKDGASIADTGRIIRDNVYGDIDEDVWRRDFTVNALYYNIRDHSILDYVGGVEDVRRRELRLIGDPAVRYREDPVRMLRAIRFATKLKLKIDDATEEAFNRYGMLLSEIAPARLFDESLKLFHSGHGLEAFEALCKYGLFGHLYPLADQSFGSDRRAYKLVVAALRNTDHRLKQSQSVNPAFIFAAILWGAMVKRRARFLVTEIPESEAFRLAADEVFSEQIKIVAIPRRFTTTVREIWHFQARLSKRTRKHVEKLLGHLRFRAAYDFLLLRVEAGEPLKELGDWWTKLQELDGVDRESMITESRALPRNGRRLRTKRKRT
ncbi:MAG TPA: polynucleotide adenylyltransferase PcnB [Gammaproteobacteria bacterium]|nr:polynucleotide adenylyltransferase PcnB [Gammaproteobacteria bacterium]|tara:strand:- start:320 stop:1597 length:1278 start_codon:yes stop_codon:yes gene_type:complete